MTIFDRSIDNTLSKITSLLNRQQAVSTVQGPALGNAPSTARAINSESSPAPMQAALMTFRLMTSS
ncbi:MAG: hypothetical protein R3C05_29815 [Pirellulaceae bacterium]